MTTTIRVLRIPADDLGAVVEITPDLESLRAAIGGGYLECLSPASGWHVYFDEEGGPEIKDLPVNLIASHLIERLTGGRLRRPLHGDVIFLGTGAEGDETDVPTVVTDAHAEMIAETRASLTPEQ